MASSDDVPSHARETLPPHYPDRSTLVDPCERESPKDLCRRMMLRAYTLSQSYAVDKSVRNLFQRIESGLRLIIESKINRTPDQFRRDVERICAEHLASIEVALPVSKGLPDLEQTTLTDLQSVYRQIVS